jgi:hypothetical protein
MPGKFRYTCNVRRNVERYATVTVSARPSRIALPRERYWALIRSKPKFQAVFCIAAEMLRLQS